MKAKVIANVDLFMNSQSDMILKNRVFIFYDVRKCQNTLQIKTCLIHMDTVKDIIFKNDSVSKTVLVSLNHWTFLQSLLKI